MTSNAFCSVYLLLLFCCKIQNVITYKFHYFLKELNYLISVWSKKNVLVNGRNSEQNKSQSCLGTKFEVLLLMNCFFKSPFEWSEPHFFFQTDNITCSKDMNLHFGRRCIIRNAFKNAWIGCAGILHQQMNCGLSGFFCYDLRKQMKCCMIRRKN